MDLKSGGLVIPTSPNGMKLEKFVFDVFPFASRFGVLEGKREEEFSPLKNGPNTNKSSPISCRAHLLALHRSYLQQAGAQLYGTQGSGEESGCELSPLLSYGGEGLSKFNGVKIDVGEAVNFETTPSA